MNRILLVDDDRDLIELVAFVLSRAGYKAVTAYDHSTATQLFEGEVPDLVVMEARFEGRNDFDLLRDLRRRSFLPIIIVSSLVSEDDKVLGFELGADDYLTKPFSPRELLARIRARLKRDLTYGRISDSTGLLEIGPLVLDSRARTLTRGGKRVHLSASEFRLLQHFMSNPETLLPTQSILKEIWGTDDLRTRGVLRVMVQRLRRKIEDNPGQPRLLETVTGLGFIFHSEP